MTKALNKTTPGLNHHWSLLLLSVFITSSLLDSCLSAPVDDPWWFHPCEADPVKIRHSRSATNHLVSVNYQLKVFIIQLKDNLKRINKLYKEDTSRNSHASRLSFLKVKKMKTHVVKAKGDGLKEFYTELQRFAGTLDVLRHIPVKTDGEFNEDERDDIYNNSVYHMRNLLCEVQDTLKSKNEHIPKGVRLKDIRIKLFKKVEHVDKIDPMHQTDLHNLDVNFFKKTRNFFSQMQKHFKPKKSQPRRKKIKKKSAVGSKRT